MKGEGLEQERVLALLKKHEAESFLSPEEKAFLLDPNPSDLQRAKFAWRYEGLEVLLWALGLKEALPNAKTIVDVASDVSIVKINGLAGLIANAKPRSVDEVLEMNDLYYCLHWAAIELRLQGRTNDNINEEIEMERHYALNWLIRYLNQDWDDVSTDT